MEIVLSVIALVIFVSAIFFGKDKTLDSTSEVLSDSSDRTPQVEVTPSPSPTAAPTSVSTVFPQSQISTFIYPSSKAIAASANKLELQSTDDPGKITDWYKEKIQSLGVNVKSFVTTKVNNNVLNKLSGSSENLNIAIEIKKEANSEVLITVVLN